MAVHPDTQTIGDDFNLMAWLYDHEAWSEETFGKGRRTNGVTKHIEKELAEIRNKPNDLMEWVDVLILAFDGALRAGYEPETIISALLLKQKINKDREWPKAEDGEDTSQPVEHVRH